MGPVNQAAPHPAATDRKSGGRVQTGPPGARAGEAQVTGVTFQVHTPRLLEEVLVNTGASALKIPMNIFRQLLGQVATRASEIDDPKLNALMIRLTLYEVADPYSNDYDPKFLRRVLDGQPVVCMERNAVSERDFIAGIARLTTDTDLDGDLSGDDAAGKLSEIIEGARALMGGN